LSKSDYLISVIIPCYNQANYLPDALESVSAQTYKNCECIIINDGSNDSTDELALKWIKKDNRFKYIKKNNEGLASARNAGLAVIKGIYLQFLDADDVIDREKFNLQVLALNNSKFYALSYCDYFTSTEFDLLKEYPSRYISPVFRTGKYITELINDWEKKISIPVHCFLFKSQIFQDNSIFFNESLPNHEDWECWMNVFALNPEVIFIDAKLATYRIHTDSMCYDKKQMKAGFLKAIQQQKDKHKKNKSISILLSIKYNKIRYNVSTSSKVNALTIYFFKKAYKKIILYLKAIYEHQKNNRF